MHKLAITSLLLTIVLLACGAADKPRPDVEPIEREPPRCMHCGTTCGLAPVCVCEPGTKKRATIEFDVTCEPICVPGCGSTPRFLDGHGARANCTSCSEASCACRGRVRSCKRIRANAVDEDVPTVVRKVGYVCHCCSGSCAADCCGGGQRHRWLPAWWTSLTWWWPRMPLR
jgi:hypothetical protein